MKDKVNDVAEKYGVSRFDWKQAVRDKREKIKEERTSEPKALTQGEKYIQERHGTEWSSSSWKETLRSKIDEAKGQCTSRAEFAKYLLDNYGVEMPRNTEKTVSFKHPAVDETVRGVKLGAEYTAASIDHALSQNISLRLENERKIKNAELRFTEKRRADTDTASATRPGDNTGADNKIAVRNTRSANEPIRSGTDESGERGTETNTGELREKLQQIRGLDKRYNPTEQRRTAEADELSARKLREKAERLRDEQQANDRKSREEAERTKNEQRHIERKNREHDDEYER